MSAETQETALAKLAVEIRAINTANGWDGLTSAEWANPYKVPALLGLVHTEVSEAMEAFRENDREHFLEEMADVVIRVLDCVGGLTGNFDAFLRAKLEKNRQRGHHHGGKRV